MKDIFFRGVFQKILLSPKIMKGKDISPELRLAIALECAIYVWSEFKLNVLRGIDLEELGK